MDAGERAERTGWYKVYKLLILPDVYGHDLRDKASVVTSTA